MSRFQSQADKLAIGLSLLCSIHCLLLPAAILLIPSLATVSFADDETFHKLMILGVLPCSVYALTMGCRRHRRYLFMSLGFLGVTFLSLAAFTGHKLFGESGERYVTVISSCLIAVAHFNNQRLCHMKRYEGKT